MSVKSAMITINTPKPMSYIANKYTGKTDNTIPLMAFNKIATTLIPSGTKVRIPETMLTEQWRVQLAGMRRTKMMAYGASFVAAVAAYLIYKKSKGAKV